MKFFGVIGFLLLAVWYIPAMVWGVQITQAMSQFQKGDGTALASLLDGPAPLAWWRNRSELNETFSTDELNHRRKVSYEISVPFVDLLNPGEAAPDEVFRDVYASARAPARIMAFCPELLETLALRCDVTGTSARIDRDGTARIEGDLVYLPAYRMGDPSTVQNGDVFSARARLSQHEDSREGRAGAIGQALTVCDALRETFGNCVLTSLSARKRLDGSSDPYAEFTVYANKAEHNRDTVRQEVERATAATIGATQ